MRAKARARLLLSAVAAAVLMTTAGCGTPGPYLRSSSVPATSPRVITTDAKLRNTFMVPPTANNGASNAEAGSWRVCAEASPDVFSALSASTSASIGGSQSPSATQANAQLARAVAEAAGTIERTQTINLLRESMYRTCERFLSGAISREAFVVQAGRDWRAMIAILAIEQLTRTARPAPTIIVPASTNAVVTSPSGLAGELRSAAAATEDAQIRKENADAAFTAAGCPAPAPADGEAATVTALRQTCAPLLAAQTSADQALRRAQAAQTALSNAMAASPGQNPGGNASTGSSTGSGPTVSTEGVRSGADLQAVANNVQAIVAMAFNTNEVELFCVQMLSGGYRDEAPGRQRLQQACMDYALQRVNLAAGVAPEIAQRWTNEESELRAYLGSDAAEARTRWSQLLAETSLAGVPELANAGTVEQMVMALDRIFAVDRQRLIGAMRQRRGQ